MLASWTLAVSTSLPMMTAAAVGRETLTGLLPHERLDVSVVAGHLERHGVLREREAPVAAALHAERLHARAPQ